MEGKDFFESEGSTTIDEATDVKIEFVAGDGATTVLKENVALREGEVIDTAVNRSRRPSRTAYCCPCTSRRP
jgi:isocitrate dehydrogenase